MAIPVVRRNSAINNNNSNGYLHFVPTVYQEIYRRDFVQTPQQLCEVVITLLLFNGQEIEARRSGPATSNWRSRDSNTSLSDFGVQALSTTLQSLYK